MERCIIITSYLNGKIRDLIDLMEDDFILCADGGYQLARDEGITPSLVIGDFDSQKLRREDIPGDIPVKEHPVMKDLTDTGLCLEYAVEQGYRNIMVLGGFGGREDHTVANLQNLFCYARDGALIMMIDKQNIAFPLIDSDILIPARKGWTISVFSHTEKAYGVTIRGALYPLEDHILDSDFPLGVGNSAVEDEVYIKVERGALLVMMGRDDEESLSSNEAASPSAAEA